MNNFFKPRKNFNDPITFTMTIGNQQITATYDEWEELFEDLESIFGINAVEDDNPEKLDMIDCEIAFNRDISNN